MFGANAFGWAYFADGFAEEGKHVTPGAGGGPSGQRRRVDERRQDEEDLLIALATVL